MKIKVFLMDSDYCCRLFSCDGMEIADLGESHYEIRFLFDNDNPLVFRLCDRSLKSLIKKWNLPLQWLFVSEFQQTGRHSCHIKKSELQQPPQPIAFSSSSLLKNGISFVGTDPIIA